MTDPLAHAATLSFWSRPVEPQPISGGITNANFSVEHRGERYFVRIGDDIDVHGVKRFNEAAASRAAFLAGLSPEVVHVEPGVLVTRFIDGRTLTSEDVRNDVPRVVDLVRRCHHGIPQHLRGPALVFWVFHVVRDYAATLREVASRFAPRLAELLAKAATLESTVGPIDLAFGHNDLLASNLIDDGKRLWLIDWDYAGFNSPLFDLGGLASNNGFSLEQEHQMLEGYFDAPISDALIDRYRAMKCASLLRETMWSMVSEHFSSIDFDYVGYSDHNFAKFEAAFQEISNG